MGTKKILRNLTVSDQVALTESYPNRILVTNPGFNYQ